MLDKKKIKRIVFFLILALIPAGLVLAGHKNSGAAQALYFPAKTYTTYHIGAYKESYWVYNGSANNYAAGRRVLSEWTSFFNKRTTLSVSFGCTKVADAVNWNAECLLAPPF